MAASMSHVAGLLTLPLVWVLTLLSRINAEGFDFDNFDYPGLQFELKFEVLAGDSQCFYQKIRKGATLVTSFEVLRGADRNVDMIINKPDGEELESHLWTSEGATEKQIQEEGVYKFCIDNSHSRFSSKMIYMYIMAYSTDDWDQYAKELEEFDVSVSNVTVSMQHVEKQVGAMRQYVSQSRLQATTDWYVIQSNYNTVQLWSLCTCVIIAMTSALQAYFLKRLFTAENVTSSQKPRA